MLTLDSADPGRMSPGLVFTATPGGKLRFTARWTLVNVDPAGKPSPRPARVRDRLAGDTE